MLKFILPDMHFNNIYEITPDILSSKKITALIADLDETLAQRTELEPSEKTKEWISKLLNAGITITIVSNNNKKRVSKFCESLGVPYLWSSLKPLRRNLLRAMKLMGSDKSNTAVVGDKPVTDVYGAWRCGIASYLVTPISKPNSFKKIFKKFFGY